MARKSRNAPADPPKPRDPYWRLRRLLGVRKEKSAKAYDRQQNRSAARKALKDNLKDGGK